MTTALSTKSRLLVLGVALVGGALALALAIRGGPGPKPAGAASHREAPLISLYPASDITDFFMFRSYEPGKSDRVVLIMDVFPGGEPSSGPNYFNFDPSVVYRMHVDNNRDGRANDVVFEFRFENEIRGLVDQFDLPVSYLGCGVRTPPCATQLPPITALDGPGSEGLGLRQRYSVTARHGGGILSKKLASGLIAVPSNVGPSTMPDYPALAAEGIHELGNDIRVFAGQRGDPFYIDLGGVFDTLNFRRNPPLLTQAEDENDNVNPFGTDMIGSLNVQAIAIELPASLLTKDGKDPDSTAQPKIGAYASTTQPVISIDDDDDDDDNGDDGDNAQIQRLANPLVNELIIGTEDKDRWNTLSPHQEAQFRDYYVNPRAALALQLVFGVSAATSGREDLVNLLLKYQPADRRLSELLRLDVSVSPTPLASQRRMTVLATPPDTAGWPNGRRPKDDVTDIAVRVVGGPNYVAGRAGDGVNKHFAPTTSAFPFLATPQNGRNRVHENPTP
jgi:Domain of unknown function (DUF4331)